MKRWYPKAKVRRYRLSGGRMVGGGPARIVLHTTETKGIPRYGSIIGRNSAPHFTVDRSGLVLQHFPIDVAARAMRNRRGGVQTNRQGVACVQIELVGYAKYGSDIPAPQMRALRDLVDWIVEQTGATKTWRPIARGPRCYGYRSPCRMTPSEWVSFGGICGHSEVPENTHWDPGDFDFSLLFDTEGEDTMLPLRSGDGYRSRQAKNEDVKLLQIMLNKLGAGLAVDGAYGPKTSGAVRSLLGGDGDTVDAAAWAELMDKTMAPAEGVLRRGDTVQLR